ncbi:MAG: hypothetical protein JWO06_1339, partial [Bacteroidota bacterium]|nr:hypothetical protein [Bacteroidota bacterium]
WEQWNDASWHSYYEVYENGTGDFHFGNYIFGITCGGAPVADFNAISLIGCSPLTAQFLNRSSNGASNFLWTFQGGTPPTSSSNSPTVVYSTAGTYNVTLAVSGSNGGDTLVSTGLITVFATPTATVSTTAASSSTTTDGSATVTPASGTAPYGYLWDNGDTLATAPSLAHGTYNVTVTDANGCSVTETATVNFTSGIAGIDGGKQVTLYPNPSNDVLNVLWSVKTDAEILVTDLTGKEVKRYTTSGLLSTLDIREMAAGVYVIHITDKQTQQQESVKFTKF